MRSHRTNEYRETINSHKFTVCSIIISGCFALLYYITPPAADDLLFLSSHSDNLPIAENIKETAETIAQRWTTETGRLGTFISIIFLFFHGHTIFSILSGIMTYLLITFSTKAANIKKGSVLSWLLLAAITLALPWYDYLFLCSYGINYLWSSTLAVASIYVFTRTHKSHNDIHHKMRTIGCCILMFITGWMHEAYGVPLCVAATGWLILHRKRIHRDKIAEWIALGAGTLVTFCSKAFWNRTGGNMLIFEFPPKEFIIQLGPSILMLLIFAGSIFAYIYSNRHRNLDSIKANLPKIVFFCLFVLVSSVITFRYYCGARSSMPTTLISLVGASYIFNISISRASRKTTFTIALLSSLLCISHLAYAVKEQYSCLKEYEDIEKMYDESEDGSFYYDVSLPKLDFSLMKTSVRFFQEKTPMWMWDKYHNGENGDKQLLILPTAIEDFQANGKPSKYVDGAQIYNDWIILDPMSEFLTAKPSQITIFIPDGSTVESRYRINEFTASDGRKYFLITPHEKVIRSNLQISDFRFQ